MDFGTLQRWPKSRERRYLLALLSLMLAGLLLRIHLSIKIPLWNDEAITANVARSLSENGIPSLPSGKEYWRGFPYVVLVSISERIFGHTDVATRIPSILIGTGTIALTYITGKEFFNRKTGLVAASIVTFLPWQLAWGIQVRMYVMLQFLYLASILLIYRLGERIRVSEIFLLALTISLAMATHRTAYILPLIALTYFFSTYLKSFRLKKIFLLSIPLAVTFTLYFLYVKHIDFFYFIGFYPENFSYQFNWLIRNEGFFIVSGFLGAFLGVRKYFKAVYLLTLGLILPFSVYAFFVDYTAKARYIHFMIPMICLLTGLLFSELARLKEFKMQISSQGLIVIFVMVFVIFPVTSYKYDFDNYAYRPYFDQESVYEYISEHDKEEDILITQWTSSATYYYSAPNYSLQGDGNIDVKKKYSYGGKNVYSGAEFIFESSKLSEIIANSSGWLVMRDGGYRTKPNGTREIINKEMTEVGDFENMRVWRWDKRG